MSDIIEVKVTNPEEFLPVKEVEPEYYTFVTYVVAFNTVGYAPYQKVLELDPLRKDWSIYTVDQPVVLCHAFAQVGSPRNQDTNVPNPEGAYLGTGTALTFTGTGEVWVVATSTLPTRVSLAISRRRSI